MTDIARDISHVSHQYHKQMNKLIAPLRDRFGIHYFTHQTVSREGEWSMVGTHAKWLEHSASNQYYRFDPSLMHPDNYQSGVVYASAHPDPDCRDTMFNDAINNFNLDHCLCIMQKTSAGCEFYFFGTETANIGVINVYINQLALLRQFVTHFKQEAKHILAKTEDHKVNIATFKSEVFHSDKNIFDVNQGLFAEPDKFIFHPDAEHLSNREKDCLHHLLQGKTAKETARILDLSFRTVESHIEHIKNKLGCQRKRDLLARFSSHL